MEENVSALIQHRTGFQTDIREETKKKRQRYFFVNFT